MRYSSSPVKFILDENLDLQIDRPLTDVTSVIDNWVDTVVFTCIRRFKADEEFGFGFWDNEFIAMNLVDFNNGADFRVVKKRNNSEVKVRMSRTGIRQCEKSVLDSISYYIPFLKNIEVEVLLSMEKNKYSRRGENSKYVVRVSVKGRMQYNEYIGTRDEEYRREVEFFMDPFLSSR
ncbi:MAG: hypothetical protein IAB99_05220 [Bacteroidetes bacterium]|uniref:Uncharacterized protein n=1 Tax=Candidatus Cryptobacteroides faecipullorum TaxID=2840764 RepID=A0A9D9NB28_9BACT|nr:hypothetical protein [Candidatus Cryptobacteroides faecipullorum]